MIKHNKGITLIALIITIIVLLILAAVTINMVLGENGLFNKAKTSAGKYENAQEKENALLSDAEKEMDKYLDGKITAEMVGFTPDDPNWKAKDGSNITNVQQALDYLFDN